MFRLITLLFFLGIFLGPYIYILDSRIHLLRIFTPIVFILLFWKSKKISIEFTYAILFFIAYYIYTILISIPNFNLISIRDVINFTYIPIIVITSIMLLEFNPRLFYKTFSIFLITFLFVCMSIAIYEEVQLDHLRLSAMNDFPTIWDGYYHMPTAFYVNPNDFAVVYLMGSMFLLFYFKNYYGRTSLLLKSILIISSLWIVFVTGTRINQIAIILYLVVYFQIWKRPLSISIGISTLLILSLVFFEFNPFDKLSFSYESNSVSYRLGLYQSSFKSITQNYGIGYGVNLSQYFYTYIVDSSERGDHGKSTFIPS